MENFLSIIYREHEKLKMNHSQHTVLSNEMEVIRSQNFRISFEILKNNLNLLNNYPIEEIARQAAYVESMIENYEDFIRHHQ
jgi:hypothetical protein